jgi:hypothetical protein
MQTRGDGDMRHHSQPHKHNIQPYNTSDNNNAWVAPDAAQSALLLDHAE